MFTQHLSKRSDVTPDVCCGRRVKLRTLCSEQRACWDWTRPAVESVNIFRTKSSLISPMTDHLLITY